jgi:hypothetical protein
LFDACTRGHTSRTVSFSFGASCSSAPYAVSGSMSPQRKAKRSIRGRQSPRGAGENAAAPSLSRVRAVVVIVRDTLDADRNRLARGPGACLAWTTPVQVENLKCPVNTSPDDVGALTRPGPFPRSPSASWRVHKGKLIC